MQDQAHGRPGSIALSFQLSLCSILLLAVGGETRAQTYLQQTGAPTFATVEPVELGFVDASNGNLHIEIPSSRRPSGAASFSAPSWSMTAESGRS